MRYQNPIIPGFHPDPSICRVGEDYYLVTSSFEYFPGVPVFHSKDLVHWEQIGHCLTRASQLPLDHASCSGGIFAPTLRWHDGRFYMVTTNTTRGGNFYVWTDDPAGEWSEPIYVRQGGIDPSLLFADGKVYFTSTGAAEDYQGPGGIFCSEIDITTGAFIQPPRWIWAGTGGQFPEGPHLYQIDGTYYLLIAEGGTEYGHMETIARADTPYGPFAPCPHNPILSHRSYQSPIQATGHADLVQAHDGHWWLVCLGIRPVTYPPRYHLGRETFLAPVVWNADGWPVVGDHGHIALEMDGPTPPAAPVPTIPAKDDFDASTPGLVWNFLRNPYPADWSLTARPGWLRLTGSAVSLNDQDSPAFLGRRQEDFNCVAETLLDFTPRVDGEEAGLTAQACAFFHYAIAVARVNGQRCVLARRRVGSITVLDACQPIPEGPVTLRITAEPKTYHFAYQVDGGEMVNLLDAETAFLATEVAGGFTGVYFGLYATGNGTPSTVPADFDWFVYQPV